VRESCEQFGVGGLERGVFTCVQLFTSLDRPSPTATGIVRPPARLCHLFHVFQRFHVFHLFQPFLKHSLPAKNETPARLGAAGPAKAGTQNLLPPRLPNSDWPAKAETQNSAAFAMFPMFPMFAMFAAFPRTRDPRRKTKHREFLPPRPPKRRPPLLKTERSFRNSEPPAEAGTQNSETSQLRNSGNYFLFRLHFGYMRQQLKRFIEQMDENSVAVIPAAHEVTRSYDTEFKFQQDPDFYYLTGFPEPDAIAVIDPKNKKSPYTLYVRPRDPLMETWYGRRQGVEGAVKNYGADRAFSIEKFAADLPKLLDGHDKLYYRFSVDKALDQQILQYLSGQRVRRLKTAYPPHTIIDPTIITGEMRLHKTPEEVELMQVSADIAAEAHILAMKKVKPGMNEGQVEALMEAYMKDKGASGVAYNSIVGGGDNATILHYVENNMPLKDGDLILIDAGAQYNGYASDITRTFPVNGKFTPAQREVYDVVLDVQLKCIEATKTGNTVKKRQEYSIELLTEGMVKLGLLKGKTSDLVKKKAYLKYYMHGVGHYLGLDVHDAGRYFSDQEAKHSRPFAPGMVLTVEPGIYVPPDDKTAPAKYRGIGIRIEDDVLVTEDGNRNLTAKVTKDPDEIEAIMRKPARK